uniref:Disease resistance protein RPS2 n=1 Tax=Cajanus cajan TaxID=3821 RepID=A0A151S1S2_CAJCA|nr:Disease resistance protein RPS2 [Cajanus cajan]
MLIGFLLILMKRQNKLEVINIQQCKIRYLFYVPGDLIPNEDGHGIYFKQMRELKLIELYELTHIWYGNPIRYYGRENLRLIHIKSCPFLICLFNYDATKKLHQLNELKLEACESLRNLVPSFDKNPPAKFPSLTKVELKSLSRLECFYSYGVELPSLKSLTIEKCPPLTSFKNRGCMYTKFFFIHLCSKSLKIIFCSLQLSLDKLKVLYVLNQSIEELWHYNYPSESFCELENLTLRNNKKLLSVFSPAMIVRFNKLKKLTLEKCELLAEVFILEGDKPNHDNQEMLPQLRVLAMSNLSNLTCFWNKEPQVPFFLNLVSLFIIHCHCLKSLFSLSQAQNLKKLKILRLCNCEKVEEVISSDKGEKVATIFPKMKCLVLKDLPKLVNFCQEGGCFNWPNLQTVRVNNIPSMKTFLRDDLNTPLLKSVYITFAKKLWLGNLNKTISYMHNNPGV